jgi:hypothetical protein
MCLKFSYICDNIYPEIGKMKNTAFLIEKYRVQSMVFPPDSYKMELLLGHFSGSEPFGSPACPSTSLGMVSPLVDSGP